MKRTKFVFFLSLVLPACGVAAQTNQMPAMQPSDRLQAAAKSKAGRVPKPPIGASAFDEWPSVGGFSGPRVSDDGNYAICMIRRNRSRKLVIQAIKGNWRREIDAISDAAFTQDSRTVVFVKPKDILCLLTLGTSTVTEIAGVTAFKLVKQNAGQLLAYQLSGPSRELVVRDLATPRQQSFSAVTEYFFSGDGNTLLLQMESENDNTVAHSLNWVNLPDGKVTTIWHGNNASNFVFDSSSTQLAFTVEAKGNNQVENSLWYYKVGTGKAILLANNQPSGIDADLKLERASGFSADGGWVFFTLKEKVYPAPKTDTVKLNVWSYTDPKLQSQQLSELSPQNREGPRSYIAVIHVTDRRIIRLQRENERVFSFEEKEGKGVDALFITNRNKGAVEEWYWNRDSQPSYYFVLTRNWERKRVTMPLFAPPGPERKYLLLGGDDANGNIFSYEIATGVTRNLTKDLPIPLTDSWERGNPYRRSHPRGLQGGGWTDTGEAVIYEKYDIWLVDPAGTKAPVNITNGYGRRHHIVFRLATRNYHEFIVSKGGLILSAFNESTKDGGFYSLTPEKKGDPVLLTMGPYSYKLSINSKLQQSTSRDAEIYVVERESAAESPNYYWTTDFKSFSALSHVQPETDYNWLTTELVTWKTFDGRSSQGVLYKPENFDPKNKYPLILHYYEKHSDKLNVYQRPEPISDDLEIPWFVSRGYLVFTPDIDYTIGFPGRSAYNSVVSAAKYLTKFPWVDSTKMGVQGHSWGGFETNYIVTHTDLFAAAMSSSGKSNMVSAYGSLFLNDGSSLQWMAESEVGQSRIGSTPWQRPDLYIENSPIFRADKVTTPLLMMNNNEDPIVHFTQGVEFFTALRRLGKKVWMLQYDGEGHVLSNNKAKRDLTIRITQFFDHYLKGAPAPKWMTDGIPARQKGIETGLELDMSGRVPGPGLVPEKPASRKRTVGH